MMQSQEIAAIRRQICQQASIDPPEEACQSCVFLHGTEQKPYSGAQCNVFALRDHIGRIIAMRIYRSNHSTSTHLLQNEVKRRREIERLGLKSFQQVISFSETGNQLIQNPFICLSWAEGEPLTWSDRVPETRSKRNDLIKKLANICLDLLSIQEQGESKPLHFMKTDDPIGSKTGMWTNSSTTETSAKDEITAKLQRKIKRAEKGQYPGGNAESCIKQLDLLERYWIPELDSAPRVLVHGDLSANNVIVDKDSNLVRWSTHVALCIVLVCFADLDSASSIWVGRKWYPCSSLLHILAF